MIHFAGFKAVGESVAKPLDYYENNLGSTFSLVRAMQRYDVDQARLLLQRDRLRHRPGRRHRGPADVRDQPLRLDQGDAGADPAATWPLPTPRHAVRAAALLQPGRRARRPARSARTRPRSPNNLMPYIAQVAVGRRDKLQRLRRRLRHPRRHRRARLHPRRGPRRRPRRRARGAHHHRRAGQRLEPRLRARHQRARAAARLREGGRPRAALRGRARRRPGDVASSYADPSKANAELGWRTIKSVEEMCADTWRWQSQNPQGYAG